VDKKHAKSRGKQPKNSIEDAFGLPLALVSAHDAAPPKDPNAPSLSLSSDDEEVVTVDFSKPKSTP
jgi:hypothetical protein